MAVTPIVFGGFPDYMEPVYTGVTMSGAADAGFPVTRLRDRALYRQARLTATEEWIISWTYGGETRDISGIVLADHNFPAGVTVQPLLYPTSTFTVGTTIPLYDGGELEAIYPVPTDFVSSEVPEWGSFDWGGAPPADRVLSLPQNFIHLIMQESSKTSSLRVPRHIAAGGGALIIRNLSTAPTAYASAGMLMTTKLWQPSMNFRWNWKTGMTQLGDQPTMGRTGRYWGRNYGAIRKMSLEIRLLERSEILDFPWTFGFERTWESPLLVVPEPDSPVYWWACAGLFRLEPGKLPEMEPRPTLKKLFDLGQISLVDFL